MAERALIDRLWNGDDSAPEVQTLARKTRGRKPFVPAPTFEEALAVLAPPEAAFVRHALAGETYEAAYGKAFPAARSANGRAVNGHHLAKRPRVAHALALGRQAGAVQAISGIKYDLTAAHDEINAHIRTAIKQENMNAVASLMREKLKLHRLTDNTPAAMAGAQFTLVIKSADGSEKVLQPGQVIDVKPREDE